ncbi:hypothetical protein GCM10017600_01130 [Streptosporangium carneum]|uniref:Uncharacterized protein n=1 Tax=Streptosporangium carneum TaxID=47481 RepID=A0A9W6HVB5_9ACTN|nr:hypothetical protein GCM10017600_01130 [Streptosporangium carneum]
MSPPTWTPQLTRNEGVWGSIPQGGSRSEAPTGFRWGPFVIPPADAVRRGRIAGPGSRLLSDLASTERGAAKDKNNYSVRAVYASCDQKHGDALQAFYGERRLLACDPEKTSTEISESPFWGEDRRMRVG